MKIPRLDDERALARILERQKRLAFDLERGVPWQGGIDLGRYFVPLDPDAVVFPGAGPEDRRVLSQYLGLVIAQTFAEMETALVSAKDKVWKRNLQLYPVNPEFEALGEQFFAEEEKHSRMFKRYLEVFSQQTGVDPEELRQVLPAVNGSMLLTALKLNSDIGGQALWWVLILVEEVSIVVYKQMRAFEGRLDPLYLSIHRRHFEEESRHSSYSYWMLEHLYTRNRSAAAVLLRKTDLLLAQALEVSWALNALSRIRHARRLQSRHPFFAALVRLMPILRKQSPFTILQRLFLSAPFISLLLNPNYHRDYQQMAAKLAALEFPVPSPHKLELSAP